MGRISVLAKQIELKSGGDVVYEIFRYKPHHTSTISPIVQSCDLHEGEWGSVGSVICWNYTQEGKTMVAKEIIAAADDEKKSITFKVVEGDLLEFYTTFSLTIQVDKRGENYLVTWTFEYEKVNKDVPDPNVSMDLILDLTKDIETNHRATPRLVAN